MKVIHGTKIKLVGGTIGGWVAAWVEPDGVSAVQLKLDFFFRIGNLPGTRCKID